MVTRHPRQGPADPQPGGATDARRGTRAGTQGPWPRLSASRPSTPASTRSATATNGGPAPTAGPPTRSTKPATPKRKADDRGRITQAGRDSFGAHAREWIDTFAGRTRRGFGESTRQRYRESLELYAIPFFDTIRKRKLADITRRDAKAFVVWLTNHEARGGRPLTASTIDRTLAAVSIMFNDAIDDGIIPPGNPFNGLRANVRADDIDLDADDNDRRALTHDELADVLGAADEDEHLMLTTLADTGVRWGELCELRGRDLKTGPARPVPRRPSRLGRQDQEGRTPQERQAARHPHQPRARPPAVAPATRPGRAALSEPAG